MTPEFLQEGFEKQLSHLMEECSEVIKVGCKIQRFGRKNQKPGTDETNEQQLIREMKDLVSSIDRLWDTMHGYEPNLVCPCCGGPVKQNWDANEFRAGLTHFCAADEIAVNPMTPEEFKK